MNCPFCKLSLAVMKISNNFINGVTGSFDSLYCKNEDCMIDDMTRFIIYHGDEKTISSCAFIIDNFHVLMDCKNKTTTISKLEGCILMDPIHLDKLIDVDMTDLASVLEKVKTWLLFS